MSWLALRRRVPACDALDALAAAPPGDRFHLEHPEAGEARVGVGAAVRVGAGGPGRFDEAARDVARVLARIELAGDDGPARSGPQAVGGFAFDAREPSPAWAGFGPASFVVPELLWVREGDAGWITAVGRARGDRDAALGALEARIEAWRAAAARPRPEAEPASRPVAHRATPDDAPAAYVARVARALEDVAAGEVEKVVVARSATVTRAGGWRAIDFLAGLRRELPGCASFLVTRGDAAFFGASPERLLRRRGARVETAAVAGTAPRGRSPERDRALATALLESKKERDRALATALLESKKEQAEHAVVLRFLKERLGRVARSVSAPESPSLLRLEGLQHLRSPVVARLDRPVDALALAGALHPTPATNGAPDAAARAWIARHEGLDRGWYAGPVGWCDAAGDGELWVALRSGLARGDALRIFAGAGVVAGSDPRAELAETRLKLATLLQRALEI